jgi:Ala-tRNA(Pro) deacylase
VNVRIALAASARRLHTGMNATLHDQLVAWLNEAGVAYRLVTHAPTPTSVEAAQARGEPLGCGAKALVVKADGQFRLLVIPADQKLDSRLVRKSLGLRELRFATPEELAATVGLPPGAIPPFGEPLLHLKLVADVAVGMRFPQVAFNAASLTASIVMAASDWERLAKPERATLTVAG